MKLWSRDLPRLSGACSRLALTAFAVTAGACSAEIGGADQPNLSLTEDRPSSARPRDARRADLSGADSGALARGAESSPSGAGPRLISAAPEGARSERAAANGETVEVQKGDTLSELASRHGVSVAALKTANGLTADMVRTGQKLALPESSSREARASRARRPAETAQALPPLPPGWSASYTMRAGDSLYVIAQRHGVKLAELERINGVTDARRLRPGKVLRVPDRAPASETKTAALDAPRPADLDAPAVSAPRAMDDPKKNSNEAAAASAASVQRQAEAAPLAAPGAARVDGGALKLRWPVHGKIVAPFGDREDGTRNDGVNIAAPMGTDVHAAEAGIVAYAGGEVAGYGQLVLVRHDNGWVTAYAHNQELTVSRGDKIRRGQVIAKAGNSGLSGPPQLHFELRQDAKPVDPSPFMETR